MKLLEENIEVNLYDCVRQSPLSITSKAQTTEEKNRY